MIHNQLTRIEKLKQRLARRPSTPSQQPLTPSRSTQPEIIAKKPQDTPVAAPQKQLEYRLVSHNGNVMTYIYGGGNLQTIRPCLVSAII